MLYSEFVEVYEALASTTKRLEKIEILAEFLRKLKTKGKSEWIYLLNGRVVPDYDSRELGISGQTVIKAISIAYGISSEKVAEKFNKIGDLGEIAKEFSAKKRQSALFSSKLQVGKVYDNLRKVLEVEGKGAIERKIDFISELLSSASEDEAKYIIRTLLSDLRVGVNTPSIIEALAKAFDSESDGENVEKIQEAYDLCNDFAQVFDAISKGLREISKIKLTPGKPVTVMLAPKVTSISEAFEAVGKPAAIEQKYDGFRALINKDKNGKISIFTRRLENVTNQFPDVVNAVKNHIKGNSFIIDSEIVGYDPKSKKYKPFEAISQRIKRKYDIEKLVVSLPVEINVFDCLYYNDQVIMNEPFTERRKIVEKIITNIPFVIRPAIQIVTDNEEKAQEFYEEALKLGEEGIMVKKIDAPYKQGRKVGYMVKMKPELRDLDLVIVGAEYGTGKRAGWLSSYIVACKDKDGLKEVGKVSSGLKEKEEEGFTYEQMTKLLKPLIKSGSGNVVNVKPEIVVSVTYQNIQESPSYSSGYALRFPRITRYRPDRSVKDIDDLNEIKKEVKKALR